MDAMNVLDFLVVVGIERVYVINSNMENVLLLTIHQITSTMDALPKMFVGAAIQRVHTLQYAGHMNTRLTAPHSDCGIEDLPREIEFVMDGMYLEHTLHV